MDKNKFLYWAFQSSQTLEPTEAELETFARKYKKDFQTRELYKGEELLNMYRLNGWRNPMFSFVSGIIMAFEHEGFLRVKYIKGEEKDVLQSFCNLVKNKFQEFSLVHFDAEIVLPYLGVRMNKNGINSVPHMDLRYHSLRPWNLTGVDVKQVYQGAGKYSYSLEDLCFIFNVDMKGMIAYEDEFTYFNSGQDEELKNSAIKKVEVLSNIHRILLDKEPLFVYVSEEEVKDVVEEKPEDILKTLYQQKAITPEIKKELTFLCAKKKLTKKDKENLKKILLGVMINDDFVNGQQDTKAVKADKEAQVDEFINTL